MASFFQKSGWTALKKEHNLSDTDTCVVKMNSALKEFHAIDNDAISAKSVTEVEEAVEAFKKCTAKTGSAALTNMITEMREDARNFREALQKAVKKEETGLFKKPAWLALKKQYDLIDNEELKTCVVKMDSVLKKFHAIDDDEITIKSVESVGDAVEAFHKCTTSKGDAADVKELITAMRKDVKTFREALSTAIQKALT